MKERLSGDMWRPLTSLLSPLTFEFPFSRRPRKGGSVTANDEGRAGLETADREDGEESRRGSPLHLVFHRRKRNSSSRKPARFCFDESEKKRVNRFSQATLFFIFVLGHVALQASTPAHIHLSFCNPPTAFTNRSRGTFSNTMRSNSLHSEWLIYIHLCSWYLQCSTRRSELLSLLDELDHKIGSWWGKDDSKDFNTFLINARLDAELKPSDSDRETNPYQHFEVMVFEICSICGEWKLINGIHWDFIVDDQRGSSLSMIHEDISYNDLIVAVLEDFGIDGNRNSVNLSYASPSKLNFGTKELPPAFIRNDRQVTSYLSKLKENGDLHLCVTIKRRTQLSPMIMSNMIQPRGGNSNHDLPIAGTSNPRETGTQKSPLIMSNMIQTQDEISSTHDSPIAGSSNVFERGTKTHAETEWNSIQRVDEVSGIQHTCISDSLISPSSGLVSNKRGLDSIGLAVYGSGKSKLPSFSSRRGRESMGEDILSPSCGDDDDLFCGKFFKDKKEMSTKLRLHAVSKSFEFHTEYSDKTRYVLSCVDERCSWSFRAKSVKGSQSFFVRHYVSKHTCDTSLRTVSHRQATAKLLGTMVSNHYEGGKIGLKPKQIMEKARNDHGVVITYSKAWRSQEHGQDIARGTPDDSYEALPSWFHMIKEKNPGSVTFIEVDAVGKFKYAFLSLGPSIRGFKLMRKVLSVDGAHLKSKYKGTLLAATAQDGNFHLYPIAFAIVDSENEASWSWFMKCLKTIIPDEEDLVFVSDRAASIEKALLQHYPVAHHGICIFHFQKNVQDNFKSSTLVPLVVEAGYAYTKADFDCYFQEIEESDIVLADYLRKADFRKWTRAYSPANRFNIMTSNLAESINSLLKVSREYPIVCLFDTIRMIMTKWFTERREEGVRHMHPVTVEVGNKMKELYDFTSRFLEVSKINDSEFEVKGDTRDQVVNFQTRHCSCFVFDIEKFPCAHAIAAAKSGNKHENDYVDEFFSNERFTLAYSESVYPVGDKTYWDIPPHVASFVCRPPSTRFPSGRRKKKRIPSSWEYGKYRPISKPSPKAYKCSRCGQKGHNKGSCVRPI